MFFQECQKHLAELKRGLLTLQSGVSEPETVNAVFRAVHSLKGGAGACGFASLVQFAHEFETALDALRSGLLMATPDVTSTLLRSADVLADLVGSARDGGGMDGPLVADAKAALAHLVGRVSRSVASSAKVTPGDDGLSLSDFSPVQVSWTEMPGWTVRFRPTAAMCAKAGEVGWLLAALRHQGPSSITLDATALPVLPDLDPFGAYLCWTARIHTSRPARHIRDVFEDIGNGCAFELEPGPGMAEGGEAAPIDIMALIREFGVSDEPSEPPAAVAPRQIQDSVVAPRAQPVGVVFARMKRLVRELASATGKQVRLVLEGEGTEADTMVIEQLAEVLTHTIRNAIDHGLERPEQRRRAGKPEQGTVRLAATHRAGRIVVAVSDDGAGIDRGKLRACAVARGLVARDAILSDDEADALLFTPGLSTAEAVSDISGRGVGLDVVKRSVQSLGGGIAVTSRSGRGSTFTLDWPLTVAVIDGMVVTLSGQTVVIAEAAVVETVQVDAGCVDGADDGVRLLRVGDSTFPLLRAATTLGWPRLTVAGGADALLVDIAGGRRAALLVDGIEGRRRVVITDFDAKQARVPGVMATAILGDGRVVPILDVDGMISDLAGTTDGNTRALPLGSTYV